MLPSPWRSAPSTATRQMPNMTRPLTLLLLIASLGGCARELAPDPELEYLDTSALPTPDLQVRIAGLSPCRQGDRSLTLASDEPVTVLVHGCYGSAARFRGLAQVLAYHGQQTACFEYDYRDSMMDASSDLARAVAELAGKLKRPDITVIGHSQGALISRKALVRDRPDPLSPGTADLRLVTVSGPFAGIESAEPCGHVTLRRATLGLMNVLCHLVSGAKWDEITYSSPYIVEPGRLSPDIRRYLKINTDERDSCRLQQDGRCLEDDEVFSLAEQEQPLIDGDAVTEVMTVKAGHAEIVGDERVAPTKLIATLQAQGVLNPTPPERRAGLQRLLARVYGATGPIAGASAP